jgi:hypothetical protein
VSSPSISTDINQGRSDVQRIFLQLKEGSYLDREATSTLKVRLSQNQLIYIPVHSF